MHELAATRGIVEIVQSECEKGGIKAPHDIYLELGQLTPYVKECISLYFETLRDEEGWPKAKLHIKVVRGMVLSSPSKPPMAMTSRPWVEM